MKASRKPRTRIPPTHLLVPTDFSDPAEEAFAYACKVAEAFGARITLLHVLDFRVLPAAGPALANPGYQAFLAQHFEEARRASRQTLEDLAAKCPVPCASVLREGSPAVEILQQIAEGDVDLVVLSSHGSSGLAHFLLGSTAEKVLRKSPCPVLTIRAAPDTSADRPA